MKKRSVVLMVTSTTNLKAFSLPVNKVEFRSIPSNVATVWFNIGSAARQDWCYPLDIGDGKEDIYIDDLGELDFYFENSDDKIALVYEVGDEKN